VTIQTQETVRADLPCQPESRCARPGEEPPARTAQPQGSDGRPRAVLIVPSPGEVPMSHGAKCDRCLRNLQGTAAPRAGVCRFKLLQCAQAGDSGPTRTRAQ
jgi:hypothetical protein